ncbi:EF-P lysine aminoacylase GenX [Desulfomarina profundi]|uniref:EF-P lysine aminoacylase GenX n=1 Tax=Desulfomarina profundi TaxID=2772557 RepID=A0A8D5FDQ5_9BACT|nr:EF-P lysine aminoacylase EpmA [Desulfomarina profundi]BCL59398.1 EF-P lysine aminoacylase GenX [Desulfomarina profundi]
MLDRTGLHQRNTLFRLLRTFFYERGFLEVDTPVRQPVLIPENTITPVGSDGWFLQTSPELCMKRLLAAGSGNIFQICPCFRKEESGRLHLEEFTLLEWYRLDADYHDLMVDCRELLRFLQTHFPVSSGIPETVLKKIDFSQDWQRLSVAEAFEQFSPISLSEALSNSRFDEVLVECVEPMLGIGTPTFLYDYPLELGTLAKKSESNPEIVERFELYIEGIEFANGFSELTDVTEQRKRFEHELELIRKFDGRVMKMPERFLADLENLGRAAGIALGVDRLYMLLSGKGHVSEAVSFHPCDF